MSIFCLNKIIKDVKKMAKTNNLGRNLGHKGPILAITIMGVMITASVVGFGGSLVVEQNEYVLLQDWYTREVDNQIYETGRYYVGLGKEKITFPKSIQRIVFDIIPGSDDIPITIDAPISAKLDAIFQYKLNRSFIMDIYDDYQTFAAFKDALIFKIWAIVAESMSGITYEGLYFNRSIVNNAIFNGIKNNFDELGVLSLNFQITEVEFPYSIKQSFDALQNAIISQKVATEQQRATIIRAQTMIIEAYASANISIIEANNDAEVMLIHSQAVAQELNMTLTMESYTLGLLMNATYINSSGQVSKVFTTPAEFLSYLWIQALMAHDSSYLIIGDSTPMLPIIFTNSTSG
jgi:hypothetical protein